MESVEKIFRIPKLLLKKWTAALRSGEYQQGKHTMFDAKTDSYCCLGVLQHALDGVVEANMEVPSPKWGASKGITEPVKGSCFNPFLFCGGNWCSAAYCNDELNLSFPEIADLLERHAETY